MDEEKNHCDRCEAELPDDHDHAICEDCHYYEFREHEIHMERMENERRKREQAAERQRDRQRELDEEFANRRDALYPRDWLI